MADRYMLDTNMASHVIKGTIFAVRENMRRVPTISVCVSAITEAELRFGLAKKPRPTRLAFGIGQFLAALDIPAWDSAAAACYAELRNDLERAGTPLGSLDMLIAAHALSCDAVLVTNDRAFRHVQGLTLADWTRV